MHRIRRETRTWHDVAAELAVYGGLVVYSAACVAAWLATDTTPVDTALWLYCGLADAGCAR